LIFSLRKSGEREAEGPHYLRRQGSIEQNERVEVLKRLMKLQSVYVGNLREDRRGCKAKE